MDDAGGGAHGAWEAVLHRTGGTGSSPMNHGADLASGRKADPAQNLLNPGVA